MHVNADFSRSVIVAPHQYQWVSSPQNGVERVMLDRLGEETGRATSIVRYAPASNFPRHLHPGGEEILVLSGTFSEGGEHYPAGWYMRNPPGSSHQPSSDNGAIIFVKLWQMPPEESGRVRIDTRDPGLWHRQGSREVCPLFSSDTEHVSLQRLSPGEIVFAEPVDSAELLLLSGSVVAGELHCERGGWIRLPAGRYSELAAGAQGATFYLKTGHLTNATLVA
ncbi:cupin domain-containing protein [Cupriavidus consociatus]|uniref:cupin domain-containing protein n=1 Tax=Cupriavidus consociatus TaxID=2821357 RepID=UPI001AE440B6|nr:MULTISPECIES: cupin domain-containing protein [unclassified Cupriavidus]MBP0623370.1 cupin domain-containing protein [Cupriavidus sp. LEh25]MDK2660067.1 cupin domain-containing protein [Cupriavidus sp. LEh21]